MIYYNGPATIKNPVHEFWVTELILLCWQYVKRLGNVDQDLKPDFTILDELHGEVDLDTEGYEQARCQFDRYRKADAYNVWFAPTETRLRGLMEFKTPKSLFFLLGDKQWEKVLRESTFFPTRSTLLLGNSHDGKNDDE